MKELIRKILKEETLLLESGIRGIKDLARRYKKAKIYYHMDLDGVTTAIAMKNYLEQNGIHLGVGEQDSGEYREMKNKYWDINMPIFQKNVRMYANGLKPLKCNFEDYDPTIEKDL